jgi:hypothetical protein
MNPDNVYVLKTPDWRTAGRDMFQPDQLKTCEIALAVPTQGTGVRVVKHPGYCVPFIVADGTVESVTDRPTKTFYSVDEEYWYDDLQEVLEQHEQPTEYQSAQFRHVLIEAMATGAAASAIERFVDDVCERAGDEAADQVAGTLPEDELGVVIAAWIKSRLTFDIMVQTGPVTVHQVTPEDLAYQTKPATEDRHAAVWLIKTHGLFRVRCWVTDIRNKERTVDQVTVRTLKDPSDIDQQRFSRALSWLVETPDVEWERFGGAEGRAA